RSISARHRADISTAWWRRRRRASSISSEPSGGCDARADRDPPGRTAPGLADDRWSIAARNMEAGGARKRPSCGPASIAIGGVPSGKARPDQSLAMVIFFVSLVVNGLLAGAIYALIALAFVVVYKSSRMINFAVGEWVMFGSLLVA